MQEQFIQIAAAITPLDVREVIGAKENENVPLKDKHYVITVVDELIAKSNGMGYDFRVQNGQPYFYNGSYWQICDEAQLEALLRNVAKNIGLDRYTAEYHNFSSSLLKQFYSSMTTLETKNNDNEIKINLQNGTFVFGDGEVMLRSFDKNDFLTYQLPFDFDPSARAPLFEKYLNRVLPDVDCQNILAEYLGYVFTKNNKQEKCLLLYGSGANGKSVFFDIVNALLGRENITNYSLRELDNSNTRAQINNKLLNYSSEIDAGINKDIFKQMVTGEPLQAKILYKDVFTIYNYAKLMFNCNELPKDVEYNNAYFRRWLIVPFNQIIPIEEQDKELSAKIIKSELSGVFNWVLKGLDRLATNGKFSASKIVNETLIAYREESDSVCQFINEKKYTSEKNYYMMKLADIYGEFKNFCSENGFRTLSNINFKKRLEANHFSFIRRSDGYYMEYGFDTKKYDGNNTKIVAVHNSKQAPIDDDVETSFEDEEENGYPWD